jgi:glycosyltransferase involved in cell wall biosynthesis
VLREKYHIETAQPIVSFVGALQARKRPEVFIALAAKFPEAQFVAVGRRDPAHEVLAKAKGLKNFQWVERMPREDIAALLSVSKIFVFPSLNEPAAAVILEAMASGCVPVLSASGGNGEFLDGAADTNAAATAAGFLVSNDFHEMDAFAAALRKLLDDRALLEKMSVTARRAAERHSLDMVAEQYEKHILELCPKNPPKSL